MTILIGMLLGVASSLIASEFTEVSPYLARRLVRWAARIWSTTEEAGEAYAEEWLAVINDRPGKLLQLATALGFVGGAVGRAIPRQVRAIRRSIGPRMREEAREAALYLVVDHDWDIVKRVGVTLFLLVALLVARVEQEDRSS